MASFLPYFVTVICGLEMLLILGTGVGISALTPDEVCKAIEAEFKINLTDYTTKLNACYLCVKDQDKHCTYVDGTGPKFACQRNDTTADFTGHKATSYQQCNDTYIPPKPDVTTSTAAPITTPTTTPPPSSPTTASTKVPSSSTVAPSNATTAVPGSTTTAGPTTTAKPTTAGPSVPTTAAPPSGGFSFPNFFGGMVFTVAASSLAYVAWRFYRARNPNYHTF